MSNALDDLIAKVEAGWPPDIDTPYLPPFRMVFDGYLIGKAWDANNGSLDAALALHNAVLPGWDRQIGTCEDDTYEASVARPLECQTYDGTSHDMARAWLIAILKAMKEGKQ